MRPIDANKLLVKQISIGGPMQPRWISVVYADDIDAAPTITPESLVRHGRWIRDGFFYECSECGTVWHEEWIKSKVLKYCNECGAKMDLDGSMN